MRRGVISRAWPEKPVGEVIFEKDLNETREQTWGYREKSEEAEHSKCKDPEAGAGLASSGIPRRPVWLGEKGRSRN